MDTEGRGGGPARQCVEEGYRRGGPTGAGQQPRDALGRGGTAAARDRQAWGGVRDQQTGD
jgi:hypothetical protein